MITPSLSQPEKQALEERHKACRDKRECDRIKAVLLCNEGWTINMIAQALRKHEDSIKRYITDYICHQKLSENRHGSTGYLTPAQTKELVEHLSDNTYFHQHEILQYIEQTFNTTYSISGLNKWLHQHDFSYKQPKGVPHKFCPEKQAIFIDEYEQLKATVASDEPILFMDAVHPTQATKITSGWIRTGLDKPIKTTGSRTRLSVLGVIQMGRLSHAEIKHCDTVNSDVIVEFFQQIRERYSTSQRIHIILDGAGYHRSAKVIEAAKRMNIILHTLPPYSPNLNPIERLWKVMNHYARNNHYFATAKEFREAIEHFFTTTLPHIGDSLNGTINDNFQRLESAN